MNIKDLEEFERALKENKINNVEKDVSFLETINAGTNENIISRYLLFLMKNNIEILNGLLKKLYKDFTNIDYIEHAENEYIVDENKRIDILFEAIDDSKDKVLIVIENKIYSYEHSNQCKKYFDYCSKRYSDYSKQYYLYLCPDYNSTTKISSSKFCIVHYSDLLEILESFDDKTIFERDFINLIENKLRRKPMDKLSAILAENYAEVKEKINFIENRLEELFKLIKDEFIKQNTSFRFQLVDNKRTLRFYKDASTWWNGDNKNTSDDDKVYFYVEVKCEGNIDFYVQRTLRVYTNNPSSKPNRYVPLTPLIRHSLMNKFKVFERKELNSKCAKLSEEWIIDISRQAIRYLDELVSKQEKEIERYNEFK